MSSNDEGMTEACTDQELPGPTTPTQRKRVQWKAGFKPPASKPALVTLYDTIKESLDKLIFMKFKPQGATSFVWALVPVDLEDTDERRAQKRESINEGVMDHTQTIGGTRQQGPCNFGWWYTELTAMASSGSNMWCPQIRCTAY